MLELTLGLFLVLSDPTLHMPNPTKEINTLVEQLGSDEFRVREKANLALEKLGWDALKAVYLATKSPDAEVRLRATRIYNSYFVIYSDDKENLIPEIWFIEEKKRFPKGFKLNAATKEIMGSTCKELGDTQDVAKSYYLQLKKEWEQAVPDWGWTNEHIAKAATQRYLKDRLLRGEKHADLKKEINVWVKNSKECEHYFQTKDIDADWPLYDWQDFPPGPMLKKEDFKHPSGGPS